MQRIQDVRSIKQIVVDSEMRKRENRQQPRKALSANGFSNATAAPVGGTDFLFPPKVVPFPVVNSRLQPFLPLQH